MFLGLERATRRDAAVWRSLYGSLAGEMVSDFAKRVDLLGSLFWGVLGLKGA